MKDCNYNDIKTSIVDEYKDLPEQLSTLFPPEINMLITQFVKDTTEKLISGEIAVEDLEQEMMTKIVKKAKEINNHSKE